MPSAQPATQSSAAYADEPAGCLGRGGASPLAFPSNFRGRTLARGRTGLGFRLRADRAKRGAACEARSSIRSSLRDRRCEPHTGQLFARGQKRILDVHVGRRPMSGLSAHVGEVPAGHLRPTVIAYPQPHLGRYPFLQVPRSRLPPPPPPIPSPL